MSQNPGGEGGSTTLRFRMNRVMPDVAAKGNDSTAERSAA